MSAIITLPNLSGNGLPGTIQTKTTTYTAAVGEFVQADATSTGFTVTLPTNPATGALVAVKKIDATANMVTIAPAGGGTIDGDPTATTSTPWAGAVFEHVGSNVWRIASSMTTSGPVGPVGATGPTGPTGATGPAGPSGSGGQSAFGVTLETGRYGVVATSTYSGPTTFTQGELLAVPVFFSRAGIVTSLATSIWTGGSAGAIIRLGLYDTAPASSAPGSLLADSGAIVATGSGFVSAAISVAVAAGALYHAVFVAQGAPGTSPTFLSLAQQAPVLGLTVTSAQAAATFQYGYSKTGITGALPGTWGALTQATALPPRLFFGS
jgi:hypothetical protein